MRKSLITLSLLAFTLTSLAFFRPPPPSAAPAHTAAPADKSSNSDLSKTLAKLDDEWSKAAAAKDADRVTSYYVTDSMIYPPNEPMVSGRAGAKKMWAAYFADPNFISITWKTVHSEVAQSGDLGFTTGTYEFNVKGPAAADGKPATITEKGKYLCTWRKQADGAWKVTHDMWNSDAK